MSGHPEELATRRLWTQLLAGSASLACHVGANAQDDKKETVNGEPVKAILNHASEATKHTLEQWKILNERNATDEETSRSMNTLRQTMLWCGRLIRE
jgi:hypothetical protein